MELDNLERYERVLAEKYGKLSNSLETSISKMKKELELYEIGEELLSRIGHEMYDIIKLDNVKEVEQQVKHLADTFWDQV